MLSGRLAQTVKDAARLAAGAGLVLTQSVKSLPGFKPLLEGDFAGAARAALKNAADTTASVVGATAGRVRDAAPEFTRATDRATENVTHAAEEMGRQATSTAGELRSQVEQVVKQTTTDVKSGVMAGVEALDPEARAGTATYRNQAVCNMDRFGKRVLCCWGSSCRHLVIVLLHRKSAWG